ncbi:MAG: hypothetical protein DMF24_02370, partial [Verrucomicrobia bacterium]
GDYRIMNVANPNSAMLIGAQDMWGYEATVVRRYAEFMTWSQGGDPDQTMSYVKFVRYDPLFAMLRLRYVLGQRGNQLEIGDAAEAPMSHLQLVSSYRVLPDRNAIFDALRSTTFDPAREVILESEPEPKPSPSESVGTARIVAGSTDAVEIEADVEQACILLITDAFTPSWRAVALPGSVQTNYKLLPANYILRAGIHAWCAYNWEVDFNYRCPRVSRSPRPVRAYLIAAIDRARSIRGAARRRGIRSKSLVPR